MKAVFFLGLLLALPAQAQRQIEVCFVLDTTGSMSGLIATAKEKIWYIANEIVHAPENPSVRFCLMGFRDRGDEYITRHTDLSGDLDMIHAELLEFVADGGGDGPEAVNQALLETVQNSSWSNDPEVLKLIFLVGDAPPHTDYDEPQYDEISSMAFSRGIIINPVLCGGDQETGAAWDQIARTARGQRITLSDPSGGSQTVTTPMDQDLAMLGPRLDALSLPYGPADRLVRLEETRDRVEGMDDATAADRLSFKTAADELVANIDLISAIDRGEVSLETIKAEWLPEQVRSMSTSELDAHLQSVRIEREEIRRVIRALVSERRQYVQSRQDGDGFDSQVSRLMLRQLAGEADS